MEKVCNVSFFFSFHFFFSFFFFNTDSLSSLGRELTHFFVRSIRVSTSAKKKKKKNEKKGLLFFVLFFTKKITNKLVSERVIFHWSFFSLGTTQQDSFFRARSTSALPVCSCRRILKGSLEQNYLFVWDICLRWFMWVNNKTIVHSKSRLP